MSCKPLAACSFFLLPWLRLLWGPREIWRSRCHPSVSKSTMAFLQHLLSFASFRGSWPELHFYKWHKGCKIPFRAYLGGTTGSKCLEYAISGCWGQAVVAINRPSLMRHEGAEDVWKELSFSHLKEGLRDGLTYAYMSFCCHLSVSWGLKGIWVMRELRTLRRRPYLLVEPFMTSSLPWPNNFFNWFNLHRFSVPRGQMDLDEYKESGDSCLLNFTAGFCFVLFLFVCLYSQLA